MLFWLLLFLIALIGLAYYRANIRSSALVLGGAVLFYGVFGQSLLTFTALALALAVVFVPLSIPPLRQEWLSRPLFARFRRAAARLDAATLAAIDAGTPGWEAELLGGEPDWARFDPRGGDDSPYPQASMAPSERLLLDGPLVDFLVRFGGRDTSANALAFLRERGFFGLSVPSNYGGSGLSPAAQSAVVERLAVSAPNAAQQIAGSGRLTWIHLLLRHGDEEQRYRLLPDIASGRAAILTTLDLIGGSARIRRAAGGELALEIALDARVRTARPASAGDWLGLLLDVGDPDGLLPQPRRGPTCALLPVSLLAGLAVGSDRLLTVRATLDGVPLSTLIGGADLIGQGETLHAECAAVAHALAGPGRHAGVAARLADAAAARCRIHAPFAPLADNSALTQEALATCAATAWSARVLADATARSVADDAKPFAAATFARVLAVDQRRRLRAAAQDLGFDRPALRSLLDALESPLDASPGINAAETTNEGHAGQYTAALLRAHRPFMLSLAAMRDPNPARALVRFDAAFWEYVGQMFESGARALVLGIAAASFGRALGRPGAVAGQRNRINRYSAALAFTTDIALARLGRDLSSGRSERVRRGTRDAARLTLTTWLADALAQLWIASHAVDHFVAEGAEESSRGLLSWVCADAARATEESIDTVLRHLSAPILARLVRLTVFPFGRGSVAPRDDAHRRIVQGLQDAGRLRERLAMRGVPAATLLTRALTLTLACEPIEERIAAAPAAASALASRHAQTRIAAAEANGVIVASEAQRLRDWLEAVRALDSTPGE